MFTPGMPQDLDDESLRRIARSFYVVKMVRYALLLLAALGFAAACIATEAPLAVTLTLVVLAGAFAVAMVAIRRRYVTGTRPSRGVASSSSPRG